MQFICNHAELTAVACHANVLSTMLATLPSCPTVKLVVVFGGPRRSAAAAPHASVPGVGVVTLDALRAAGKVAPVPPAHAAATDVCTICYTSGTTGNPKGVVLTVRWAARWRYRAAQPDALMHSPAPEPHLQRRGHGG